MHVTAISGLGAKAAACFLVDTGAARFLLDLGEGPAPQPFPDLAGIGPVDAVLVSHGHADHIGGLHLVDTVGDPPIYATAMTRAFAGHPRLAEARELPLRGRVDIAGTSIETGRAGHAAGGIWMRIGGEGGVLYTGDLCRESVLYPVDVPLPAATLIADASYGTYDAPLERAVADLVVRAGQGPLLLPAPPTGRGLEIAVLLHEAGLPVALCAQHRHVARLMLEAETGTLAADGAARLRAMLDAARQLDADSAPDGAMIAANAAASAGIAGALFVRFAADPAVAVLFTGHVDEGTPAWGAIAAGRAGFLRWNVHPRLRDLAWLHETVRPSALMLAFCAADAAGEVARLIAPPDAESPR